MRPQFNEVPRDKGNWFVISRVCYIEVLFHTVHFKRPGWRILFIMYCTKEFIRLHRNINWNLQMCIQKVGTINFLFTISKFNFFFFGGGGGGGGGKPENPTTNSHSCIQTRASLMRSEYYTCIKTMDHPCSLTTQVGEHVTCMGNVYLKLQIIVQDCQTYSILKEAHKKLDKES